MHFEQQAIRERKAPFEALQSVSHRRNVSGYFGNVFDGCPWTLTQLVREQIAQARLSAFDLRGQNGLFAHERIEKQMRIRQGGRRAIEATDGKQGLIQRRSRPTGKIKGRKRNQWRGACTLERDVAWSFSARLTPS